MVLKEGERVFTVVEMRKSGQENKSGSHKKTKAEGGRYVMKVGQTVMDKAKVAFSVACNKKDIKGQCTLDVTMKEITRGSNNDKLYKYKCKRTKKETPVIRIIDGKTIPYEYDVDAEVIKE